MCYRIIYVGMYVHKKLRCLVMVDNGDLLSVREGANSRTHMD